MTTITDAYEPDDVVLVTGANGHVAQHVVDQLLSLPHGPRVRATVRSAANAKLIESFYEGKVPGRRLEVEVVPDMVTEGAFDEVVKGVTYVAHIASPLVITVHNVVNDLLIPARQGTVGILQSALKSPSVKSVAITSSFAAVFDAKHGWRPGYTYTAADWNPITFEEAAAPDLDLNTWPEAWRQYIPYSASKAIAERAAWDFYKTNSPHFTLSTVLPTYIAGPNILPLTRGLDSLNYSQRMIWRTATDNSSLPAMDGPGWVDVRDVARAHIAALVTPEAAGRRWLVVVQTVTYSEIADIVRSHFPLLEPSDERQQLDFYTIDATPALTVLGLGSYIPLEQSIVDFITQVQGAI